MENWNINIYLKYEFKYFYNFDLLGALLPEFNKIFVYLPLYKHIPIEY